MTDMSDRRPIRDQHAPSEIKMSHQRPTCPNGDRHAQLDTNIPAESNRSLNKYMYLNMLCLFITEKCKNSKSVEDSDEACRGF